MLKLQKINKAFNKKIVLDNISLTVDEGSFFTLLGPSGCGKTTLLRIIAGFVQADSGAVWVREKNITELPPEKRQLGIVFQNFALFPHMNVFENIAYGIKIRGFRNRDLNNKVRHYLKTVRLDGYEKRQVSTLSGGEQQRVALARALVIEPKLLLLDEPLSNLDATLRHKMRDEIKELHQSLGITTIFVTHDQSEALNISDQMAIIKDGKCRQIGTPKNIYENPASFFVADFVGNANIFEYSNNNRRIVLSKGLELVSNSERSGKYVLIRPENIELNKLSQKKYNEFPGQIQRITFNGNTIDYEVGVNQTIFKVCTVNAINQDTSFQIKDVVFLHIPEEAIYFLQN